MIDPLPPERLYRRCDPASLSFRTTAEVQDLDEDLGQDRAIQALRFGLRIRKDSFNIFAFGQPGVGKHPVINRLIREQAAREPVPDEWCYVHNFAHPSNPRALRLPAGRGFRVKREVDRFLEDLRVALPAAFETEEFRTRREAVEQEVRRAQEDAFGELQRDAEARGIALLRTPMGMAFAPVKDGNVIGPDEFRQLPEEEQKRVQHDVGELQGRLQEVMRDLPQVEREQRNRMRELVREVTAHAVNHLVEELKRGFADLPTVQDHFEAVREDIVEHVADLLRAGAKQAEEQGGPGPSSSPLPDLDSPALRKYRVNLLVDHAGQSGAPVVYEDHPTYANLVGRIEHLAQFGALVTDFTLIRPGALHRANGGYLVIDARRLLVQPFAYEELKRILRSRQIRVESLAQTLAVISTVSLTPEPVPLSVKVVLVGDPNLYYMLSAYDPDFPDLFKVPADFAGEVDRSERDIERFARLVAAQIRQDGLKAFDAGAVARTVEHASRMVDDIEKLSLQRSKIADLLREADYWAGEASSPIVTAAHVQWALDAQTYRLDRLRERVLEIIRRDIVLIDTAGAKPGQINGLSVSQVGGFSFGRPARITTRVRLGRGQVVDIEREVALGGPIHSKGVLILQGFLGARFARDFPLSLHATLVFEQSYSGVEGDSASSAELYAILSALSDLPIRQNFAVTGSVNQYGQVQPIGGVNEKIEGFFDVCSQRGLTGDQGVLIPVANVQNLMLRHDVVEAAREGRFRIFAVETIDQGIEILTGTPAGEPGSDLRFPDGTVNFLVDKRLREFAEALKSFGAGPREQEQRSS